MSYHPVGHRGVEPRHTRLLSDGPRPTSWVVASGRWRCRAPRDANHALAFKASSRARRVIFPSGSRRSCPPAPRRAQPDSSRRLHLGSFTIQCGWRWSRTSSGLAPRPPASNGVPSRSASHPLAESGEIESQPFLAALVSSEARRPGRFTLLACAGRDSNPHVRRHTVLARARLPSLTPPAHKSDACRDAVGCRLGGSLSIIGRSGSGGIPLPTLAFVSRSAHGITRYCVPRSLVLGAGLPCHGGDAALRAGRCYQHPKGFMLAPADPGYRLRRPGNAC